MIKACIIKNDVGVRSGLALSPAEIENLTNKGRSAALGSLEGNAYYDNLPRGADVPIEDRRGITLDDVWRSSKASQHRIMSARTKMAIQEAEKSQQAKYN